MARLFGKITEMVEDDDTLVFVLIDEARVQSLTSCLHVVEYHNQLAARWRRPEVHYALKSCNQAALVSQT